MAQGEQRSPLALAGLVLGPALFALILMAGSPGGMTPAAHRLSAITALMIVWWVCEALPIAVTALVPLALFPLLQVTGMEQAARPYANPYIFLFMGGFLLAQAMQKWDLHRRLSLMLMQRVGGGRRVLLFGFMAVTAVFSMWVSNTATAVMMLPIAMAVLGEMEAGEGYHSFSTALMLGIAYSASAGGVATLIGTPPNVILAGQAKSVLDSVEGIGFLQWMLIGLPVAVGFLALIWTYLTFFVGKLKRGAAAASGKIRERLRSLGSWQWQELAVMGVFLLTALAWLTRTDLALGPVQLTGWQTALGLEGVHDGTVAMAAAVLLFLIPTDPGEGGFLMDWEHARDLPWDVLLLMGGGFALAEGFVATGLDRWVGGFFTHLEGLPLPVMIFAVCLISVLLSEAASNTATVAMLLPVLAAAAPTLGVHPMVLMVPATFSASLGFMLPIATPPNAIVFGSGYLRMGDMVRAGFVLDLAGAVWITAVTSVLVPPVFGI